MNISDPIGMHEVVMIVTEASCSKLQQLKLYFELGSVLEGTGFCGINSKLSSAGGLRESSIGSYSAVNSIIMYTAAGNYCSIGHKVDCCLGNHPLDRITTSNCTVLGTASEIYRQFKSRVDHQNFFLTTLGHDVWVGANMSVITGVEIGSGAVIGAGAVVTKDVPAYAIAAGNPAKVVRYRFKDDMIERLLKSKWFLYDWANIEIPWGNAEASLDAMQRYAAAYGAPPLLNQGYIYKEENGQCTVTPAAVNHNL